MKFCSQCVNPSTRPNMTFDEEGLCPVCQYKRYKQDHPVDWDARKKELGEIIQWGREHSSGAYDCIVTVSGGKDSVRQAFIIRDEMGGNPLLVSCVYPPEQLHERGAQNLSTLIEHGFDTLSLSLNPQVWKVMMRNSYFQSANWCRSTEMALYAIPIHVAIAYRISLIFLGENPVFTVGEKSAGTDGDANKMKYCHTLQGGDPRALASDHVTERDLHFYSYPPDDEMEWAGLRVVYLGYYVKDFMGDPNARFAIKKGLNIRTEPSEEIGEIGGYTSLDEEFKIVSQMTKYVKFGFGQVTDQMVEAMHQDLITREEALELIRKYDGKCHPRYIKQFCRYLEISETEFWEVVERFRGHHVWEKDERDQWRLKNELR